MTSLRDRHDRERRCRTLLLAACILALSQGLSATNSRGEDLRSDPPTVTALEVKLARAHDGPTPRECDAWPTCDHSRDNARLFVTFDVGKSSPRALTQTIALDLGAKDVVRIERGPIGTYEGDFCLDARALCESAREKLPAHAGSKRTIRVFRGREIVREREATPIDLDALWKGERVSLMSAGPPAEPVDPLRTLMITDRFVISDKERTFTPCGENVSNVPQPTGTALGKWTFGRLMTLLAGTMDPKLFLRTWIVQLDPAEPRSLNSFPISQRSGLRPGLLVPWCKASSQTAACDPKDDTTLDLAPETAPFRLLAIVNRIDLADVFSYGSSTPGSAGELRFVFAGHNWGKCSSDLKFFVILEYEVKKSTCAELTKWAKDWVALDALTDEEYLKKLEEIVDSVVVAPPGGVRIRTSEAGFVNPGPPDGKPSWVMRQFDRKVPNGAFEAGTLDRTPDASFMEGPKLAQLKTWIETTADVEFNIDLDRQEIPVTLPGNVPLAAAEAGMFPADVGIVGTFWDLPGIGTTAYPHTRHHFSLNTCQGCHAGDTRTSGVHVRPGATFADPVTLSEFLKGGTIPDPRNGVVIQRKYGDLARRAQVLECIANGFGGNTPCICDLTLQKLSMPH